MKHEKKSKLGARIGTVLLALVIFAFGYLFGHANLQLDERYIPRLVSTDLGQPNDVDFSLFWDVYDEISQSSLTQIDAEKALYGAISGLVESLGDPYSSFLDPDQSKAFEDDLSGRLEGIGAEIGRRNGVPSIIAPLEGSPAEKAGLKTGDKIVAVDDESTENLSIDEVVLKIRGEKGTDVKLTILRPGEEDTREITITRDEIDIQDVTWGFVDGVAVVEVRQFGDSIDEQFEKLSKEMKEKGVTKMVIDLRNNPGGLLDKAVDVAGMFLPKGTLVVKQQARDGEVENMYTTSDPLFTNDKIVVLVNEGSASASEILAGAIQDFDRGTIIGETTYGKGTVQIYKDLPLGAALKLTIAEWLTPQGRHINDNGIEPDIIIERTDEDYDAGRDPQLDKAKEEVNKM